MATRNLSRKYFELRNGAKANRHLNVDIRNNSDEEPENVSVDGLLKNSGNSSNWKSLKESLPPIWIDKIEQVDEDIGKIQNKIRELSSLHTKRLLVNFEADEFAQEKAIDEKTQEITNIFHHAEVVLKKFGAQSKDNSLSLAEVTVRKNMQSSMARKLQGLSQSFRSSQKEYLAKMQAQKSGDGTNTFDFLADSPKNKKGVDDFDKGFSSSQLQVLDNTEEVSIVTNHNVIYS